MDIIQSIIIAIVEGLTEFIPVSSTGHMIITSKLLNVPDNEFTKMFTIAIQLGAILAVVVLYWKKFFDFKNLQFYLKLMVGVIPALLLGFLFSDKIDELLESTTTVAIALLLGGIVLLFIDKLFKNPVIHEEKEISFVKSFIIGIWQCLAMIPGVSRSAASIIGGMQQKLTRSAAAEFSFFLAVPTMLAATGYKLLKHYKETGGFTGEEVKLLAVGNAVAFVVALLAIKFFIGFLTKHGFRIWGIYRIIIGILLLILIKTGYIAP
ncbi:MAG: undecaprenyl-diphosphate phosphatase [Chitinophagaceae bacterium]|nr:MAG: undecaprenyl-diphosphate phosphatase [Chitinophagaceae bacterium]